MFIEIMAKSVSFLNDGDYSTIDNKIAISGSDNSKFTVNDTENSVTHQIHFLLCESCFWCACYLINKDKPTTVSKCPICIKMKVKSRPISDNYDYKSC